jgi:hypothetical protein
VGGALPLDLNGATHGIGGARKLGEHPVPNDSKQAAMVLSDCGLNDFLQ